MMLPASLTTIVADKIRILKQVIPPEDADDDTALGSEPINTPTKTAFSLPVMTNNFRRFNARSVPRHWIYRKCVAELFTELVSSSNSRTR